MIGDRNAFRTHEANRSRQLGEPPQRERPQDTTLHEDNVASLVDAVASEADFDEAKLAPADTCNFVSPLGDIKTFAQDRNAFIRNFLQQCPHNSVRVEANCEFG